MFPSLIPYQKNLFLPCPCLLPCLYYITLGFNYHFSGGVLFFLHVNSGRFLLTLYKRYAKLERTINIGNFWL